MEYTPKYPQPFTFDQARRLDVPTITKEIERLENSLLHLDRTQEELREHLNASSEEDRELFHVVRENEDVIASQKERIIMLKLALEELGVNTGSRHYNSGEVNDGAAVGTPSNTRGPSTANNEVQSRRSAEEETDQAEDGMYL